MRQPERLPQLSGGNNFLAGTYVAEQRSGEAVDLVSTLAPRSSASASPVAKSGQRRRRAGAKFERAKAPVHALPALGSALDPLVGGAAAAAEEDEDEEPGQAKRAADGQEPQSQQPATAEAFSEVVQRLYPGVRSAAAADGDVHSSVPSDAEFHTWLALPLASSRATSSRAARRLGTPRDAGAAEGLGVETSLLSAASVPSGDAPPAKETTSGRAQTWHVVMLQSTFQAPANTAKRVSGCLAQVLALDEEEAGKTASEALQRRMTPLAKFSDRREAFEKVQTLRHLGVNVTVVSEIGLPGRAATVPSAASVHGDYGEFFRRTLRSAGSANAGGSSARRDVRMASSQRRADDVGLFRADSSRALLKLIPSAEPPEFSKRSKMTKRFQAVVQEKIVRQDANGKTSAARGGSSQAKEDPWGGVLSTVLETAREAISVLEPINAKQKISSTRKEACEMMRLLVYGCVGNENARNPRERIAVFYESIGEHDKIMKLFNIWDRLDNEAAGRVDMAEFKAFAQRHLVERPQTLARASSPDPQQRPTGRAEAELRGPAQTEDNLLVPTTPEQAQKFIMKLSDRMSQLLLSKKTTFVIEDVMRIIWPCAAAQDMKNMWKVYKDAQKEERNRIQTPPILPDSEFQGLCSVFRYFDADRSGTVRVEELSEQGLLYQDQATTILKEHDQNGDGELDMQEFCEMMCPSGYRAHPKATTAYSVDGARIMFDSKSARWERICSDAEAAKNAKRRSMVFG